MSSMVTFNGERVSPQAGAPTIPSIGISLGRVARFCGHTKHYYTVLAHSLTVAALLPPDYGIYGLMHDAQEALVGDVPTPMKTQVARNREYVLLRRIYENNGLSWPIPEIAQELVDEADHLALLAEALVLEHPAGEAHWGTIYDASAVALTRKNLKKVKEWLEPDKSAAVFTRAFKDYQLKAGLLDLVAS